MTYIPNAGAVVPEFTLAADVANAGTVLVNYPTGFVQGDFTAGLVVPYKSFIIVNRNDKFYETTPAPVQAATATATTGGTLAAATYYYVITAILPWGETAKSNEQSQVTTGSASTVTLTWAAVPNAVGYRVYRGIATGVQTAYLTVANGATVTLIDNGSSGAAGTPPASMAGIALSFGASQVTITNNTGATISAGAIVSAWLDQQDGNAAETFAFPLNLASITAADIVAAFRPGVDGYVENVEIVVNVPATTAAKLATLTPKIGTVATTGGVLALTSANMTPMGARVVSTQVTALNRIKKSDSLTITASAVTAFVEGTATLFVRIRRDTL